MKAWVGGNLGVVLDFQMQMASVVFSSPNANAVAACP